MINEKYVMLVRSNIIDALCRNVNNTTIEKIKERSPKFALLIEKKADEIIKERFKI